MGVIFYEYPRIFDDVVADYLADLAPTTAQVSFIAEQARGMDPEAQWRGIVALYECFCRFDWTPDTRLVEAEWKVLQDHKDTCVVGWRDPHEAWARLEAMHERMLGGV